MAGIDVITQTGLNTTKQTFNQADFPTPAGVQFNKKQRDYQLFPEEYFTSTDVQIYFNDVYMDEMTGLSFQLNELTDQIFGYASNTWDYHARGRRIVQGQFRIAFKEAGYLWTVLDHLGQMGADSTTHLAWLMNDEKRNIYNGYNVAPKRSFGQVLENIEDIFYRNHSDPTAKLADVSGTKKETVHFDWLKSGGKMDYKDKDGASKYANVTTHFDKKGAISQLQHWLKNIGRDGQTFDIPKHPLNWQMFYKGDTWYKQTKPDSWTGYDASKDKAAAKRTVSANNVPALFNNKFITVDHLAWAKATNTAFSVPKPNSGDWYVMMRFAPESKHGHIQHHVIDERLSGHSWYERELQMAINRYPGNLNTFWMGSPDKKIKYDGRYGSGPVGAIRLLQQIAGYNDGSNGYWVTHQTKQHLEMGLEVNGVYDFPTKMAVYLFQQAMSTKGLLPKSKVTGEVDYETMMLMTYERDVAYTVEGASLYKPEELYEGRMAMYEQEVWGRSFVDNAESVRKQESFFYRGRGYKDDHGRKYTDPLHQKGFDIYINYGPLSQYVRSKLFAISHDVSFNTTVKAIRNVQIYDVQQVLDPNTGQCIEEVYLFYAKDLD